MRLRLPLATFAFVFALAVIVCAQVGRRAIPVSERGTTVNVTAAREDKAPVTSDDIEIYDDGTAQRIISLTPDLSPARIVLLVDNSLTLRAEADKLREAVREFAFEIYEGDQLLTIGYDEQAEIIQDWTDDAKALENSLTLVRKKGEPRLLDAFKAVLEEALRPLSGAATKRVIVLIGDGLDRQSKTKYAELLAELQRGDITVYALQLPDRTGGAYKRNVPKPSKLIEQITTETGGKVFSLDEAREAAKTICDELKSKRYVLAYQPTNPLSTETRRLLVLGNSNVAVRAKTQQPPRN